jgi:hypothetical protein
MINKSKIKFVSFQNLFYTICSDTIKNTEKEEKQKKEEEQ